MYKILPILFSLFSLTAFSQPYESLFGKNSTYWVFEWGNFWGFSQDTIYVEKDTIVYGEVWKKIVCSDKDLYNGGLLKEDTITGKVWYKALYDPEFFVDTLVQLAFDFNLGLGDTFELYGFWGDPPPNKEIVDSIYYINGRKFIKFIQNYNAGEYYTFIEGVGINLNIIYKHYNTLLQMQYLLCSYKDDKKIYASNFYNGNCNIHPSVGIDANNEIYKITLYPNPAADRILLNKPSSIEFDEMKIVNINGQVIYRSRSSTEIDVKSLPPGLYMLHLKFNKKHLNKYFMKL